MIKGEKEITEDVKRLEERTIENVCRLLYAYNGDLRHYLACLVAGLCDVAVGDLYTDTKHINVIQSRWLYWYCYRYMTNESYESISRRSKEWRRFGAACVGQSVAKMSMMISEDDVWAKRWAVMKRIIKIMLKKNESEPELFPTTITLKVTHPKDVIVNLKSE